MREGVFARPQTVRQAGDRHTDTQTDSLTGKVQDCTGVYQTWRAAVAFLSAVAENQQQLLLLLLLLLLRRRVVLRIEAGQRLRPS